LVNPGETHAGGVRGEISGSATGPARRGGPDIKKILRSLRRKERTGWWFKNDSET
jgi:hypothetical protein